MTHPKSSLTATVRPAVVDEARPRRARYLVLGFLAGAAGCAYLTRHALAAANTTIQTELGLNNEQMGYLFGAFSLGYLLCQMPGGWLGQRLGTRLAIPISAGLWSLMTLATAFATNLNALIVIRFLFGAAQAVLVPNQAKVLQDWIPASMRGTASSVLMVAMSLGAVASLWLTSHLMRDYPWRTIFALYSAVGVVWGLLFFWWFRATPAEMPWLGLSAGTSDAPSTPTPTPTLASASASARPRTPIPLAKLLTSVSLWGLAAMALFKAAGYNLQVTFLPAMLQFAYGLTPERAGSLTAWSLVAFIAGSLLSGILIDFVQRRTGSRYYSRSGVGAGSLGLAALGMLAAGFTRSPTELVQTLCVASFFSGIAGAPAWAATLDLGGRNTALVMGWMNTASAAAGIVFSPFVGKLVDLLKGGWGDWSLLIWLHAGFYLIAAASWLVVFPDQPLSPEDNDDAV
jgi:MFS family permease